MTFFRNCSLSKSKGGVGKRSGVRHGEETLAQLVRGCLVTDDDNAVGSSDEATAVVSEFKQEITSAGASMDGMASATVASAAVKMEQLSGSNTQDSSSQLALGSAGDMGLTGAWKCSVCKVAFDSAQSFADHLEELQKAKHKCSLCHKVFEERR